jgi:uncharacterized protein YaaN involved in tellurite resistance
MLATIATETATDTLVLTPPTPVPPVAAAKASGLVPLAEGQQSQLDAKADSFVEELAALDANSPEFGKKVDQITNMGRREIAEAAGQSNRFLDRPVKAMQEGGVGKDLAELRRTVEDLDPGKKGRSLTASRKIFGDHPLRQSPARLFRQLQVGADAHRLDPHQPIERQGRVAEG